VDQKLKNFSSGMQVRLAFAVAIQSDFDVLLLDEVLSVGDKEFQEKCTAYFQDLKTKGDKTVVVVSHDLSALANFCTRVLWLDQGRMRSGSVPEMLALYTKS